MARKVSRRLRLAGVLSVGTGLLLGAAPAHADDYTDLLSLLRAKGSLTQGEYARAVQRCWMGGTEAAPPHTRAKVGG